VTAGGVRWSSRVRDDAVTPSVLNQSTAPDSILFFSGVPDARTYPGDAMQRALDEQLRIPTPDLDYCRGSGDPGLRDFLAQRATQRGAATSVGEVVITAGSSGSVAMLSLALLDPGDVVLVEELTYPGALASFRQVGARVVPVAIDEDGIVIDDLERVLTGLAAERTTPKFLYTITNNHSPTTCTLAADRRPTVVELARRFGFMIVQDDTYGEIWFDGEHPGPLRRLDTEQVIHLGSFSKTIAPALRLGWIEAPAEIAEVIARTRTDLGTSGLVQRMVASLLTSGFFDDNLRSIIEFYRAKRDLLGRALTEQAGSLLEAPLPRGGFFFWAKLGDVRRVDLARHMQDEAVGAQLGSFFDVSGDRWIPALRLAFCELSEPDLLEGAARLGRALKRAVDGVTTSPSAEQPT
jgi:2-aminoadipate transaminase